MNVSIAARALQGSEESIIDARIAAAKLLGMLHVEFAADNVEGLSIMIAELGIIMRELTRIESDIGEALGCLPAPKPLRVVRKEVAQ